MKTFLSFLFFLAVAFVVLCHYKWEETYRCDYCFAQKTVTEWRLGLRPLGYEIFGDKFWRLTDPIEHVTPSVATPLFPPEHRHDWIVAQSCPFYLFGKEPGKCVSGAPRELTPFALEFLGNPAFRDYIEGLIKAEKLSESDAASMLSFDPAKSGKDDPRYVRGARMVRNFTASPKKPRA
jgi:hypothetical protein